MTPKLSLINADRGGYFRTVKSNYWKQSAANFFERKRKNYMATAVLIEYNDSPNHPTYPNDPKDPVTP